MNIVNNSFNYELSFYLQFLAKTLSQSVIKNEHYPFFISDWIGITAQELQEIYQKTSEQNWGEKENPRSCFIKLVIEKVNSSSFGSGLHYELFEARKHETLQQIFENVVLTKEEIMLIKEECGFFENFEPYTTHCEECEADIDVLEAAQSINHSGKELCGQCLGMTF